MPALGGSSGGATRRRARARSGRQKGKQAGVSLFARPRPGQTWARGKFSAIEGVRRGIRTAARARDPPICRRPRHPRGGGSRALGAAQRTLMGNCGSNPAAERRKPVRGNRYVETSYGAPTWTAPTPTPAAVVSTGFATGRTIPAVWRTDRVRAKGVGSAFERLDENRKWQPIEDVATINALGKLCSGPDSAEVEYARGTLGVPNCRATQTKEGLIKETVTDSGSVTGTESMVRLVPFFFEFENGPRDWQPCTDPVACMALTAVGPGLLLLVVLLLLLLTLLLVLRVLSLLRIKESVLPVAAIISSSHALTRSRAWL
jgi:hypothetical protein